MSKVPTIALDTQTFIYFLEGHPQYAQQIKKLFIKIAKGEVYAIISVISKLHMLYPLVTVNESSNTKKYEKLFYNLNNLKIKDISDDISVTALKMANKYKLGLAESVSLATAIHYKVDYFLTNNSNATRITEIHVVNYTQLQTFI